MLEKYYLPDGNICVSGFHQLTDKEREFILSNTNYLLIDATIGQRLKLLKMDISEHPLCRGCGKPLPISKTKGVAFTEVCSVQCINRGKDLTEKTLKFKETISKNKSASSENFDAAVILPREQVIEFFTKHFSVFKNGGPNGKILLDNNPDYHKSLIEYTHEHKKFNGRIYELLYGMGECNVCGGPTTFYSFNRGFANHCEKHFSVGGGISRGISTTTKVTEIITSSENFSEFEIIKTPKILNDNYVLYHKKCKTKFDLVLNNGKSENYILHCPKCNNTSVSLAESEICNFLKENGIEYIPQYPIENKKLDIYIPKFNLAIEHHGPDHSFGVDSYKRFNNVNQESENKNFHLNRHDLCKKHNIDLVHIFASDWKNKNKKEIWKSILKSKLNLNERIYARKCDIRIVSNKESTEFLNKNHLQGDCKSLIKLGLYNKDELVSIMTFGKPRMKVSQEYELIRFCNKLQYNVVGGASKLFNHFNKMYNPNSIISYCHIHIFNGNLYENLGFVYSHSSRPGYWYHKGNTTLSRYQCQKHKLNKLLKNFDSSLTESENMFNSGYRRMWDCGNKVYVWENEEL